MAKVYDVPQDLFISKLTKILKNEDIPAPSWIPYVKTGVHADRPPQDSEWWYTRCASILRKIYLKGPIGIKELRGIYGGGKPHSYGAAHHKYASGSIIRNAIYGLEKLGYVEKVEKKGRVVSRQGMKKVDMLATEILNELIVKKPELKIYS